MRFSSQANIRNDLLQDIVDNGDANKTLSEFGRPANRGDSYSTNRTITSTSATGVLWDDGTVPADKVWHVKSAIITTQVVDSPNTELAYSAGIRTTMADGTSNIQYYMNILPTHTNLYHSIVVPVDLWLVEDDVIGSAVSNFSTSGEIRSTISFHYVEYDA